MIVVSRLNGNEFAVNCNLIERIEANPDPVITLIDGTKFVIHEDVKTVIDRIRAYQSSIIVAADQMAGRPAVRTQRLQLVSPAEEI